MKNDKLIYVLLPAVAIIWLIIGYQFYQAVKPEEDNSMGRAMITAPTEEAVAETYELQLNYPDPFLKKQSSVAITVPIQQSPLTRQSAGLTTSSTSVRWEAITYHGMIENNQTTDRVGILAQDGVRKLVKEGSHIGTFTVERILRDSVRVRTKQESKYIVKQERIEWLSRHP